MSSCSSKKRLSDLMQSNQLEVLIKQKLETLQEKLFISSMTKYIIYTCCLIYKLFNSKTPADAIVNLLQYSKTEVSIHRMVWQLTIEWKYFAICKISVIYRYDSMPLYHLCTELSEIYPVLKAKPTINGDELISEANLNVYFIFFENLFIYD